MANFQNLILYFETSLCADQKSYEIHDDPKSKHLSRVMALESCKKWENNLRISKALPFAAVTLDVRNASGAIVLMWFLISIPRTFKV